MSKRQFQHWYRRARLFLGTHRNCGALEESGACHAPHCLAAQSEEPYFWLPEAMDTTQSAAIRSLRLRNKNHMHDRLVMHQFRVREHWSKARADIALNRRSTSPYLATRGTL